MHVLFLGRRPSQQFSDSAQRGPGFCKKNPQKTKKKPKKINKQKQKKIQIKKIKIPQKRTNAQIEKSKKKKKTNQKNQITEKEKKKPDHKKTQKTKKKKKKKPPKKNKSPAGDPFNRDGLKNNRFEQHHFFPFFFPLTRPAGQNGVIPSFEVGGANFEGPHPLPAVSGDFSPLWWTKPAPI